MINPFRRRGKVVTDIENVMRLTMVAEIKAPPRLMWLARAFWHDNSMPEQDWNALDEPAEQRRKRANVARLRIERARRIPDMPVPAILRRMAE